MPFQSEAQRRFLYLHHPAIARRWSHEYGSTPVHGRGEDKHGHGKHKPESEKADKKSAEDSAEKSTDGSSGSSAKPARHFEIFSRVCAEICKRLKKR